MDFDPNWPLVVWPSPPDQNCIYQGSEMLGFPPDPPQGWPLMLDGTCAGRLLKRMQFQPGLSRFMKTGSILSEIHYHNAGCLNIGHHLVLQAQNKPRKSHHLKINLLNSKATPIKPRVCIPALRLAANTSLFSGKSVKLSIEFFRVIR